jgi:hypothetical protein
MDLTKGTRIFYGGDMANDDGIGTITRAYIDKWGSYIDIKFDDGRLFPGVSVNSFSPEYLGHGGTRFVTLAAYNLFRRQALEKFGCRNYQNIQ